MFIFVSSVLSDSYHIDSTIIFIEKSDYFLNEKVLIHTNLSEGFKLSILWNDEVFDYLGSPEDPITFIPKKPGTYTAKLTKYGTLISSTSFNVKSIPYKEEIETPSGEEDNIPIIWSELKAKKDQFSSEENPEFDFEFKNKMKRSFSYLSSKKTKNRIHTAEGTVEAAVFNDRDKPVDLDVELEETIDGVSIKIPNSQGVKPGIYKLKVILEKNGEQVVEESEFIWGLISLNTKKSIYRPGELAEFIIVVLDSEGVGVCDTDITMIVTDPLGKSSFYPPNDIKKGTECGLFVADYLTQIEGTHYIHVATEVDGIYLDFNTSFLVKSDYDYEIIRNTLSKIDPTQVNLFRVNIDVEAYRKGVERMVIREFVPSVFSISDTSAEIIDGNPKVLLWDINGNKASLSYSYSVPLVWPYLYKLGPLMVNSFEEARPWYIAVDPLPELHSVEGYVFLNEELDQAPIGTKVKINDSITNSVIITETYGPPGYTGYYSTDELNASDGDPLEVTAWNSTAYGWSNVTVLPNPSVTEVNVTLNISRSPEANVTIIDPSNQSVYYIGDKFNVSSLIMILGADGINCNATLSFSDSTIFNLLPGENSTVELGNLSLNSYILAQWGIEAVSVGSTDITVTSYCENQGEVLEDLDSFTVYDISSIRGVPSLHSVEGFVFMEDGITQMPIGTEVLINATETGSFVRTETYGPPGYTGYYSTDELNATDGEPIIVRAFNASNFGETNSTLLPNPSVTEVNVTLNETNPPDLKINSSDLEFSTWEPLEGENITFNLTVHNIQNQSHAENFNVTFYIGDPDLGGTPINGNITIKTLVGMESIVVNITWITEIGSYNIFAVVDPENIIDETNETNNKVNLTLNVGAYQTLIGNASTNITLDSNKNHSLINWSFLDAPEGNIFLTDEDTTNSIDFTHLQAIGRNISGGVTFDDFAELDDIFNMTGFNDSLSNVYTTDGNTPKETDSFFLFQVNFTNVPVVNSTNSSDFKTGILWDKGDDSGNNEFDVLDMEDLVFITKVNPKRYGKYGIYDYEITYPVRLRDYKGPGSDKVVLYYELI